MRFAASTAEYLASVCQVPNTDVFNRTRLNNGNTDLE